jgi:REP element-mobilizing transposase RayT
LEPLQPDTSYHIFNHANGFENVFRQPDNFRYFLEKYRLHVSPIAETYAYCLMPNHFHLVVRIRKREVIAELIRNKNKNNFSKVSNLEQSVNITQNEFDKTKSVNFGKVLTIGKVVSNSEIEKYLSKQFANLFSCYTQSFNKVYKRMGSLFIKNFKREPIQDKTHFLNAVIYTHRNPIHHGFRKDYNEWEYSSYNEIIDGICDQIAIGKLIKMFGDVETFKEMHRLSLENFANPDDLDIP